MATNEQLPEMTVGSFFKAIKRPFNPETIQQDVSEFGYSTVTVNVNPEIAAFIRGAKTRFQRKLTKARASKMTRVVSQNQFGKGSSRAAALSILVQPNTPLAECPIFLADGQTRLEAIHKAGRVEALTFLLSPYQDEENLKRDALRMDNQAKRNTVDQTEIMELTTVIPELNDQDARAIWPGIKKILEESLDPKYPWGLKPIVDQDAMISAMNYYKQAIVEWANTAKYGTRMGITDRVRALRNGRAKSLRGVYFTSVGITTFTIDSRAAESFWGPIARDLIAPRTPQEALMRFFDKRQHTLPISGKEKGAGAPGGNAMRRLLLAILVAWTYHLGGKSLSADHLTTLVKTLWTEKGADFTVPRYPPEQWPLKSLKRSRMLGTINQ